VEASALSAPAGLHRTSVSSRLLVLRSDEQLVALFRQGNDDAFGVIHDRYRQRLFAYARQMLGGSRSDAEDVLQDVFLRAYRALRADDRPISLRAWLYRVAHNRCVDHLRRPTPAAADVFDVSRSPLHDPLAEAEQREELARLVRDVRRLPEQQRSALLMREMDGMSYAELADALDTTVPAIKSLLVRARIGLVEAIEARDADCADIRHDLAASFDRGVRATGKARRHVRECSACATYRAQLREVRHGFAALSPSPAPAGIFAKLLGFGGAGSGAAAGSSGAVMGGGAAAVSATKVAAVVCCAAALTGGAANRVKEFVAPTHHRAAVHHRHAAPAAPAAAHRIAPSGRPALTPAARQGLLVATGHARLRHHLSASGMPEDLAPIRPDERRLAAEQKASTGGQAGPDEDTSPTDSTPTSSSDTTTSGPLTSLLDPTGASGSPSGSSGTGSSGSSSSGSSTDSSSSSGSSASASSASTDSGSGSSTPSGSDQDSPPPSG
jgi:RNA polymerase sigma factor (sigma-70 family)